MGDMAEKEKKGGGVHVTVVIVSIDMGLAW
jgi:hypothetical protein